MIDILDSIDKIKEIDKGNILESIELLPKQCVHAWEETEKVNVPESYFDISNVVACGMGGSGLAARIIESTYRKELKLPFFRVNDYELPGFVDRHTLVICSSYSGNTEETIANARRAIESNAKLMVVTAGGELLDFARTFKAPFYKIEPIYNPSNQPRMAIGYSVISQLVLASKCGLLDITKDELRKLTLVMESVIKSCEPKKKENKAKDFARKLKDKIIIFITGQHLVGAMHTVNNQFNENSKNMTFDFSIPELNHHLLEGMKYPSTNKNNLIAIIFNSKRFYERISKRIKVTKDVLKNNGIGYIEYEPASDNELSQVFEIIQFGAYVNFYLSMLHGIDPSPVPWVDYFKNQLGQI